MGCSQSPRGSADRALCTSEAKVILTDNLYIYFGGVDAEVDGG